MKKNIIAWILIGLGTIYSLWLGFSISRSCLHDSVSCGYATVMGSVHFVVFVLPLVLVGIFIFLVSWIVKKKFKK